MDCPQGGFLPRPSSTGTGDLGGQKGEGAGMGLTAPRAIPAGHTGHLHSHAAAPFDISQLSRKRPRFTRSGLPVLDVGLCEDWQVRWHIVYP